MSMLITGAAGFIGSHVCRHLVERGDEVISVHNLNDYYDPALKQARPGRGPDSISIRSRAGP